MTYVEHPPPRPLAPWLECLWERRGEAGTPVRVLPDGCIDVVWTEARGTHVVGPNTSAFLVDLPAGLRVVGARLHPGAAPALLGIGAEGVRDARVEVDQAFGDPGRRLADDLEGSRDRARVLLAALAGLALRAEAPDPLVRAAVGRLHEPAATVREVARELSVSERQLRRRVAGAVGYGPKRLARVLRLSRALASARAGEELAGAALRAGYADQAHFAHECRELAGVSPSVLLGP